MKYGLRVLTVAFLAMLLLAGCSKDEKKSTTPAEPSASHALTDANGQTTLIVGAYTVNATVQDSAHIGLANIAVAGYLTHNNIVLFATDSTEAHYPAITMTALTSTGKVNPPSRIASPDDVAGIAVAATLIMYNVQVAFHPFPILPDPPPDILIADSWTTEEWHDGILSDVYAVVDTNHIYDYGVFVHLSAGVAQSMGSPFRTAVFLPGQISDYATFSSLVGVAFHLFEGDSLHYSQIRYSGSLLPLIYIDNVVAHRNFWAQFTLVWGIEPHDLDSHLWTPYFGTDSLISHVCYYRRGSQDVPPYADLDVDDVSSYGPEHVTIYQDFAGTYTYAVYHYSGEGTLATSGASVSLLKPDGTVQTFNVPTDTSVVQPYWWWHVCTVDGTTGAVTPINILSPNPPRPDELAGAPSKPYADNPR
jgi:hypothetical protein